MRGWRREVVLTLVGLVRVVGGAGSDEPVVDAGEEHGVVQAGVGDSVAVGVRDAFDEAV
jgi:hypothetical protein